MSAVSTLLVLALLGIGGYWFYLNRCELLPELCNPAAATTTTVLQCCTCHTQDDVIKCTGDGGNTWVEYPDAPDLETAKAECNVSCTTLPPVLTSSGKKNCCNCRGEDDYYVCTKEGESNWKKFEADDIEEALEKCEKKHKCNFKTKEWDPEDAPDMDEDERAPGSEKPKKGKALVRSEDLEVAVGDDAIKAANAPKPAAKPVAKPVAKKKPAGFWINAHNQLVAARSNMAYARVSDPGYWIDQKLPSNAFRGRMSF